MQKKGKQNKNLTNFSSINCTGVNIAVVDYWKRKVWEKISYKGFFDSHMLKGQCKKNPTKTMVILQITTLRQGS